MPTKALRTLKAKEFCMNRAQELQLFRLDLARGNNLDGERVARDLKENEALWQSFVFGRFEFQPLIELRDLAQGFINGDTLFLLTKRQRLAALLEIVNQWRADEVGWQTGNEHGGDFVCQSAWELLGAVLGPDDALVRVWWD
jgi:hypothetical protein